MAGKAVLGLGDIVAAQDLPTEYVDVPEWGGRLRLAGISGRVRRDLVARGLARDDETSSLEFVADLVAESLVDEAGERYASGQGEALLEKSPLVVDRLFQVASRLSGLGGTAVDEAEAGLKATPSASSGSD